MRLMPTEADKVEAIVGSARVLAARASELGQAVYAPKLSAPSNLAGIIDTHGVAIEAIESIGWSLEHWTVDAAGNGWPVFRRA